MFSIITVTYNSLPTLKESYFSLLGQNYRNWEWIVQDGGSLDGTIDWLESLADDRINWVSQPDSGIYDALNKALERAKGQWIGLLHSDDLYPHNGVLEAVFEVSQGFDVVYGDLLYVDSINLHRVYRNWKSGYFKPKLLYRGWMPPHPTLFLRKEIYQSVGLFDTQFRIAADYDYVLRVFSVPNLKVQYLPTILMLMRHGGASSRMSNLFFKSKEDWKVLKKNKVPNYRIVLFMKIARKITQLLRK